MNKYMIFENSAHDIQVVKRGWSWPGFHFGWLWALFKGLPLLALFGISVIVAVYVCCLLYLFHYGMPLILIALVVSYLIQSVFCGLLGNKLMYKQLAKKGFELITVIPAHKPDIAVRIYRQRRNEQNYQRLRFSQRQARLNIA
ncbi:DUF2628 domain-containing protein [Zooshikella harenae]|uniref:DUF2628 domain-containing protein n=1 Tax=Zooshikella harenae TaxID=2827238 RepID=A0ABS5ZAB5_9GAMM|nr:DUF2628 domain-containing protein [Zooshikella harenae]MBU2710989.1 DUF2628 domain-containing protein [Zooshikella harenae]